ncbi:hypothetical protein MTO96_015043 [Rhipicephalus appendiculatus]
MEKMNAPASSSSRTLLVLRLLSLIARESGGPIGPALIVTSEPHYQSPPSLAPPSPHLAPTESRRCSGGGVSLGNPPNGLAAVNKTWPFAGGVRMARDRL